ncbi:MAG: hypothetical protein JST00_21140 [Deltaproteobacteria bacterium]|nr:hypothetical protein [Deltaproteobacteria bacterium]
MPFTRSYAIVRKMMRTASFLLVAIGMLAASAPACSSFGGAEPTPADASVESSTEADAALAPDASADAAVLVPPPNPYGRPYPTANLGLVVGSYPSRGSVIPNLAFDGLRAGSSSIVKIWLSQLYDPEGRTHDLAVLFIVATWDVYSRGFLQAIASAGMPSRIEALVVVGEGAQDAASTTSDLSFWQPKLPTAGVVIDPLWSQLRPVVERGGIVYPKTVILDPRTMEIAGLNIGGWSDPRAGLEAARDAVKSRPPAY